MWKDHVYLHKQDIHNDNHICIYRVICVNIVFMALSSLQQIIHILFNF